MNRLDRFRFGNLHKRRLFILLILVVFLILISVLFLAYIGFFGSRAELPRIRASAELTSERMEGVGINVLEIPDANIIDDPFFGKTDNIISSEVSEARGNYFYFDPSRAEDLSSVSSGDSINVLSIDGNGKMGLRYSGTVTGFTDTMFGVPIDIQDVNGSWLNDPVVKAVESSGSLFVLTGGGKLISDAAFSPLETSVGVPFADICAEGISVYALTVTGDIYVSSDSGPFTLLGTCTLNEGDSARFISVVNGNIDVYTAEGSVIVYTSEGGSEVNRIEAGSIDTGDGFVLICTDTDLYLSHNGIFFSIIEDMEDHMRSGDSVIDCSVMGDRAFVLTDFGRVIRIDVSGDEPSLSSCDISSIEPGRICISGDSSVIAVSADNQAYYVSFPSGSARALGFTGVQIDDVMNYGSESFVLRSGNSLYQASLMSAVQVDLPIADDLIMDGDICIIEHSTVDTGDWDIYGSTEVTSIEGGISIIGTSDGIHAVSKLLQSPASELFEENLFYRVEVTMASSSSDITCYAWLEGEKFGEQGVRIPSPSDQPDSYSYVFAVTDRMLSDENLRFNISFEGEASITVYNVYVGLDRNDINSVQDGFRESVTGSAPSVLRFASNVQGSSGFCNETFYGISAFSLERQMLLCKESGADPWIVMGSSVSQEDVDAFLGYLCGSVSNPYGMIRINNGTALPWSRQFDVIYIEVNDTDGTFVSDAQRGTYVSYVISLFGKSEFYLEIKDKIVFIDGMDYDGGVMLSDADRHASGMTISPIAEEDASLSFIDTASAAIDTAIYESPRTTGNISGGEFISSLSISEELASGYNAAEVVSSVLRAQETFADLIMFDSDLDVGNIISTLRPMANSGLIYYEVIDPLDTNSSLTAELFETSCETMLFDGTDDIYIVVANHSDSLQQFTVISDAYDMSTGSYRRYSDTGDLLIERDLNRLSLRQVLQPGEYLVIEIPK